MKGYFYISWDENLGSVVEAKCPENLPLSDDDLSKYLSTISFAAITPLFVVHEPERAVLIHGIPCGEDDAPRIRGALYSFIGMVLTHGEVNAIEKYQLFLQNLSQKMIQSTKIQKKEVFLKSIAQFEENFIQKIVFAGLPDAGKTSTKLFLFDQVNQDRILGTTLLPTQGVEISRTKFMDLVVALFDTSGQELESWLTEDSTVFADSELVVFFFSCLHWQNQKEYVKEMLDKILSKMKGTSVELITFCHKIDLISTGFENLKQEIEAFTESKQIPVYFTTIKNGGNADLFLGIQSIVEKFSQSANYIEAWLQKILPHNDFHPIVLLEDYLWPRVWYRKEARRENDFKKILEFIPSCAQIYHREFEKDMNFVLFEIIQSKCIILCITFNLVQRKTNNLIIECDSYRIAADILEKFKIYHQKSEWIEKR
jgi:GTPase SAR1 family protein